MATASRTTDDKARISLPGSFANCTVLIEQVSDTELRIRKARVIPEDELPFLEESVTPLSDRDRDIFLALLDNPPPPNEALRQLMDDGRQRRRIKALRLVQKKGALSANSAVESQELIEESGKWIGHQIYCLRRTDPPLLAKRSGKGMRNGVYLTKAGLKVLGT